MRLRPSERAGFTLIELLVVVTTMALLMTLAVNLIHAISLWSDRTEKTAHHASSIHRMEEQLRRDVQVATRIEAAGERLTITMPNAQSEWQLEGDHCVMTRTAGDEVRRERFDVGAGEDWQASDDQGMATITLRSTGEPRREVLRIAERATQLEGGSS